jgi:glycine cleavage system transcriptional repressor
VPELAVAVLGPDQPGVIAALTEVLLAGSGNLEDASMTILRGQFAMTLVVDVDASASEVSERLAPVAERLGLLISVRDAPAGSGKESGGRPYVVSVHGADRPGIVHRVTAAIAGAGGNITDLSTRLAGGMYLLLAEVDLPGDPERLSDELEQLSRELHVTATLRSVDADLL